MKTTGFFLSSSDNSSIPKMAIMSCNSVSLWRINFTILRTSNRRHTYRAIYNFYNMAISLIIFEYYSFFRIIYVQWTIVQYLINLIAKYYKLAKQKKPEIFIDSGFYFIYLQSNLTPSPLAPIMKLHFYELR